MRYLILVLFLIGCETTITREHSREKYEGEYINIIIFDNCEYVEFPNSNATWGSHKGNCKNPIHH